MPQVAPIWCMSLFIVFILSLVTIHILMFFTFEKTPSHKEDTMHTLNNINWKW